MHVYHVFCEPKLIINEKQTAWRNKLLENDDFYYWRRHAI